MQKILVSIKPLIASTPKFYCAKKKLYTPLLPLLENNTLLYVSQPYAEHGRVMKRFPAIYFYLPTILLTINNYLTQWTLLSGLGVGFTFIAALILRRMSLYSIINHVHSIQVTSDLKKICFTIPRNQITERICQPFKKDLFSQLLDELSKENGPKGFSKYVPFQNVPLNSDNILEMPYKIIKLDTQLLRVEVDWETQITNVLILFEKREENDTLELDKQRLSRQELFKKYENATLAFVTNVKLKEKPSNFAFIVQLADNKVQKYQDYLLGMALGYKIDPHVLKTKKTKVDKQEKKQQEGKQEVTEK